MPVVSNRVSKIELSQSRVASTGWMPMVFKSIGDSLPGSVATWAFSGCAHCGTQDHPVHIPRAVRALSAKWPLSICSVDQCGSSCWSVSVRIRSSGPAAWPAEAALSSAVRTVCETAVEAGLPGWRPSLPATERHPCIDLLRLVGFGCVPERVGDGGREKGRHLYGWRGSPPDDRGLLAGAFFAG
jgi:hypothetical protein